MGEGGRVLEWKQTALSRVLLPELQEEVRHEVIISDHSLPSSVDLKEALHWSPNSFTVTLR